MVQTQAFGRATNRETTLGIVGCGQISQDYLRLSRLFPGVKIVACADIRPGLAEGLARAHSIRSASVEELLADDSIDIIVNLTIPAAHFEVSARSLEAGKHVYSEKPLALTYREASELVEMAARFDRALGSAPDTFLGGASQTARALIDKGAVGSIVAGTCQFMNHGNESWHPNPDFYYRPGGGPVFDMGPYYISLLVNLLGPLKGVTAIAGRGFEERTIGTGGRAGEHVPVLVPTTVCSVLQFQCGAQVMFGASWDVWRHGHTNPVELYGTTGTMLIPDPNYFGGTVSYSRNEGAFTHVDGALRSFAAPNWPDSSPTHANYRMLGVAELADAIRRGRPPRCSGRLAAHVVEVMEAILLSATEQHLVAITSSVERAAPLTGIEADLLSRPV